MLDCPFCGAPETDRFDLEGRRYLVFRCQFTPAVDPALDDAALRRYLEREYAHGSGSGHFRQMCDQLHLYVTQGDGARALQSDARARARPDPPGSP